MLAQNASPTHFAAGAIGDMQRVIIGTDAEVSRWVQDVAAADPIFVEDEADRLTARSAQELAVISPHLPTRAEDLLRHPLLGPRRVSENGLITLFGDRSRLSYRLSEKAHFLVTSTQMWTNSAQMLFSAGGVCGVAAGLTAMFLAPDWHQAIVDLALGGGCFSAFYGAGQFIAQQKIANAVLACQAQSVSAALSGGITRESLKEYLGTPNCLVTGGYARAFIAQVIHEANDLIDQYVINIRVHLARSRQGDPAETIVVTDAGDNPHLQLIALLERDITKIETFISALQAYQPGPELVGGEPEVGARLEGWCYVVMYIYKQLEKLHVKCARDTEFLKGSAGRL